MKLGIIGGRHLTKLSTFDLSHQVQVKTPYGEPSSPLQHGQIANTEVVYIARHGLEHNIAAHMVNYRANIWALRDAGISHIIANTSYKSLSKEYDSADLILPHQLIDYTTLRENTFSDKHIDSLDFTNPFNEDYRQSILQTAISKNIKINSSAVIGVISGPRSETKAEQEKYLQDGCDLLSMSLMPEAVLARELEIPYCNIGLVIKPCHLSLDFSAKIPIKVSLLEELIEYMC